MSETERTRWIVRRAIAAGLLLFLLTLLLYILVEIIVETGVWGIVPPIELPTSLAAVVLVGGLLAGAVGFVVALDERTPSLPASDE